MPALRLLVIIALMVGAISCTTSTRLVESKISVDPGSLLSDKNSEANRGAIHQADDETNPEPDAAINPQNYKQTLARLKPLAEQGNANAQYTLGYMYYNGLGVPRNSTLAIEWLMAAANQGNKKSMEALRRIALAKDNNTSDTGKITVATTAVAPEPPSETPLPFSTTLAKESSPVAKTTTATTTDSTLHTALQATTHTPGLDMQKMLTEHEQWIMDQPKGHYTIQLMATGNEAAMKRFITKNELHEHTGYYRSQRNGKGWFSLVQGSFESPLLAKKAIKQLTFSLQKSQPWIRPIAGIQATLMAR